ncbi:hypothetical protein HNR05_000421 [Leifsonia psychrotolerans]|uniref:Uncharacterized protein n=1 Tax=Glaciibacter psychrotolerans TaxID=670054 RepID=A0A7Z0EBM6_9MICO|nr:hypothetical protein [Leifsonia psychrotolerans]
MICEASMVSPRTFSNCFDSKEGVILGTTYPKSSKEDLEHLRFDTECTEQFCFTHG